MSKQVDIFLILTITLSIAETYMENFYSAIFILMYTVILHVIVRSYDLKDLKYKLLFEVHLFFIALISAKVVLGVIKYFGV